MRAGNSHPCHFLWSSLNKAKSRLYLCKKVVPVHHSCQKTSQNNIFQTLLFCAAKRFLANFIDLYVIYRGIREKGSGDVVSAVCYTIYTIYLSLCTQTSPDPFRESFDIRVAKYLLRFLYFFYFENQLLSFTILSFSRYSICLNELSEYLYFRTEDQQCWYHKLTEFC